MDIFDMAFIYLYSPLGLDLKRTLTPILDASKFCREARDSIGG